MRHFPAGHRWPARDGARARARHGLAACGGSAARSDFEAELQVLCVLVVSGEAKLQELYVLVPMDAAELQDVGVHMATGGAEA